MSLSMEQAASLLGPEQKKLFDSFNDQEKMQWYQTYLQGEAAEQQAHNNNIGANILTGILTGGLGLPISLGASSNASNNQALAAQSNKNYMENIAQQLNAAKGDETKANTVADAQEEATQDTAMNLATDTETNANTAATQKAINSGVGKARAGLVNPESTTAATYGNALSGARNANVKTQTDYLNSLGKQNQLALDRNANNVNSWYQAIGSLFGSDEDLKEPPKSSGSLADDLSNLEKTLSMVHVDNDVDAKILEKVKHIYEMAAKLDKLRGDK